MDIVVQWATILSPIIAVIIAVWASRSSAKDTAKQIAALEESTNKQIESIKDLARLQIEISSIQLHKELCDIRQKTIQVLNKDRDAYDDHFSNLGIQYNDLIARMQDKQEKAKNLSYERDYYINLGHSIESLISRLDAIKEKV